MSAEDAFKTKMPLTEDAIAAQQVQERLKSLYQFVHEIEKKRQQSENGVNAIRKVQSSQDEKSGGQYQVSNFLVQLY